MLSANIKRPLGYFWASQVAPVVKNLPANAGDIRDMGSIPGSGRSPREGHGNPLQYSCLENPMDRGVWWATVHRLCVTESDTTEATWHACNRQVITVSKKRESNTTEISSMEQLLFIIPPVHIFMNIFENL